MDFSWTPHPAAVDLGIEKVKSRRRDRRGERKEQPMYLVHQCSNCGGNVRPELGVATAVTLQHRECADRFGIGTHGQTIVLPIDHAVRHRPLAFAVGGARAAG